MAANGKRRAALRALRRIDGGKEATRDVDLATLPLYVKAGSILPLGPVKQHTHEASTEPVVLRIYPGADGNMSLYQDDGISYAYSKGQFSRILFTWNDQQRVLTLKPDQSGKLPWSGPLMVEMVGVPGRKPITTHNGSIQL